MRMSVPENLRYLAGPVLGLVLCSASFAADLGEPGTGGLSDGSADRHAMELFAGPDLRGKDGPMARIGLDLTRLYVEYEQHLASTPALKFVPSSPLMRVHQDGVVIDAVATEDVGALRDDLVALGLTHAAVYQRYVSGVMPIRSLPAVAALAGLRLARPAYARVRSGAVTSQGDIALHADLARSINGVDGTGIIVGTLSDSYDCRGGAAGDVASGDLPAGVVVLAEEPGCSSGTDEGRAMMQIVSDIAPGASQAFHTAFGGIADFASGIGDLAATAGAQVINDDVIYFAEPMFQDGVIAQAIDNVNAAGVAYFSAAGNDSRHSYEDIFRPTVVSGTTRHDFDAGGPVDTLQSVTIPPHALVIFVLQWDEPFFSVSGGPGSASDLDIILFSAQGVGLAGGITDNIGGDPVEVFAYENKGGQPKDLQLRITLESGPAPGRVKYVYFGDMTVNEYATNSPALYGHPNAAGAAAVGAARYSQTPAFGVDPPLLEYFSSAGGTPILRDSSGGTIFDLRQKPDFVAPNGGDNTFFGSDYESNGWPNFFGTSAAAPHAAGVAALMLSLDAGLTPAQVHSTLQATAIDMDAPGVDFNSGAGLLQADQALASLSDTTPDAFAFADLVDVALDTVQTSNAVTITGMNAAAAVSVTGGEYSVGCGAVFTTDPGTIDDGETVCVRHTSAATYATGTDTTLTVGGVADTFTSTTLAADTTPDAFSFTDLVDVALDTVQTSNAVTITGINAAAAIDVAGGEYSIGCGETFTADPGAINNGETVCVRHSSASTYATGTDTTLTVGGVADTFTSTTLPADTMPDAFTFTDVTDVALDTVQTSNAVTITGINDATAISVTGGEYSIGCGALFTTDPGTINDGENVCVRHTSAATYATGTDTTLTVGGVADTFTSTTMELDTDGDGVPDSADNCTLVSNPTQCDSDGDGYGNHCDGDLNNSGTTNSQDYVLFRAQLGQPSVAPTYNQADFNCSGSVNSQDYVLFRGLIGAPPGPSGLVP